MHQIRQNDGLWCFLKVYMEYLGTYVVISMLQQFFVKSRDFGKEEIKLDVVVGYADAACLLVAANRY